MKKIISTFITFSLISFYLNAQKLDLGNFENDTSLWDNWGGTSTVVDNPYPEGNTSSKVLHYEPDSLWRGISRWFDNGFLKPGDKTISLDVYTDTITVIQLALLTPVVQDEVFYKDTVYPGEWRHLVFDISKAPIFTYQHIAFQTIEHTSYYFDNITVNEGDSAQNGAEFLVNKVIYGSIKDTMDFKAVVFMKWDNDSIYFNFKVNDDSILTEGTPYLVDNIELYLDLDNSKNIHWPRNGGWVQNDTTFDDNDFQFRLIPGKDWNFTTENQKLSGVNYVHSIDSLGYSFSLNIPWDSLKMDYMPHADSLIGFDVLISDNDSVASESARNQITFNSPTIYAFNDPSLWGTLRFDSTGYFTAIYDSTSPTLTPNVVAFVDNDSTVRLTWGEAKDNIAVQRYIILQNGVATDTLYAMPRENQFVFKNLGSGTYAFSIIAEDVYGNQSEAAVSNTIAINPTVINTVKSESNFVYPNPSENFIKIRNLNDEKARLKIYNSSGQLVLSRIILKDQSIDVSQLQKGIYSLQVIQNSQQYKAKFMKK